MDPILKDALKSLPPSNKKLYPHEEYIWPIDRLPTEEDVDRNAPLPDSCELDVWKELISDGQEPDYSPKISKYMGREGRKSPRIPVPKDCQSCEVKIGDTILEASLLNESAEGFGLVVHEKHKFKVGQKFEIKTYHGWYRVQIVHLQPISKSKAVENAGDSSLKLGIKKA